MAPRLERGSGGICPCESLESQAVDACRAVALRLPPSRVRSSGMPPMSPRRRPVEPRVRREPRLGRRHGHRSQSHGVTAASTPAACRTTWPSSTPTSPRSTSTRPAPTRPSSSTRAPSRSPSASQLGAPPDPPSLSRDGKLLGVMNEYGNEVSFFDTATDDEIKRFARLLHAALRALRARRQVRLRRQHRRAPHHPRRSATLTHRRRTSRSTGSRARRTPPAPDEGGFADAQIDQRRHALRRAHARPAACWSTTPSPRQKLPELSVGHRSPGSSTPSIRSRASPRHVVPNFGDQTVSLIDGDPPRSRPLLDGADRSRSA